MVFLLFLFMPAFNKKPRTVNNEKPRENSPEKRHFITDCLKLTGRPDHPDKDIPGRPYKEKSGIPKSFKTVFHSRVNVLTAKERIRSDLTINAKFTLVEFFKNDPGQILQCIDHIGEIGQKSFPYKHMFRVAKEGHNKVEKMEY